MANVGGSPHAESPALSVVVVFGRRRRRARATIEALGRQTVVAQLELVLVDMGPPDAAPIEAPPGVRSTVLKAAAAAPNPRRAGYVASAAPVVAFLDDHATPTSGWADALIRAHGSNRFAAVGYAMRNANPETATSRCCLISEYASWLHPLDDREVAALTDNVAYRRDVLEAHAASLDELLGPDTFFQCELKRAGHRFAVASGAIVDHLNHERMRDDIGARFTLGWVFAARRAHLRGWIAARRLVWSLLSPCGAPATTLRRLFGARSSIGHLRLAIVLPYALVTSVAAGIGESCGYLLGEADAARRFQHWEIDSIRRRRTGTR